MNALTVISPGAMTTVQDLGRPGHAHEGVAHSGVADRPAGALANRLVGNDASAALLETTLIGPTLRYTGDRLTYVALTGAPAPLRIGGRPAALYSPAAVRPGDEIEVGTAVSGLRSYLAVAGGVLTPSVLGSRSTDLLGGLGPPVLARGDRLPVGTTGQPPAGIGVAPVVSIGVCPTLDVVVGPRQEWLIPDAIRRLTTQVWTVSNESNRVGIRLTGDPIDWSADRELPSEGMVGGAVQIPPSGQPVIFLADCPVTGGYPVLAVLRDAAIAAAAQLRPGGQARFRVTR